MVKIEFKSIDSGSRSGFAMGDFCVAGDGGVAKSYRSMVVLTATLLMDQVVAWYPRHERSLEFNPVDSEGMIDIHWGAQDEVTLSTGDGRIGSIEPSRFLNEVQRACRQLYEDYVKHLSREDAGRSDMELALSDFQDFISHMGS